MGFLRTRKAVMWTAAAFLACLVACSAAYYAYLMYLNPNIKVADGEGKFLYIAPDDTFDDVVENLRLSGCVKNIETFRQLALIEGYDEAIVPGRYALRNNMHNKRLLRNLEKGYQTPTKITFNNIRTKEQLAARLAEQLMTDSAAIVGCLNDSAALAALGATRESVIGLFVPNTYEVYWTISPDDLLKRMCRESERFWNKSRQKKADEMGLTRNEVLTLASIVEEESKISDEKLVIAGLYLNRLRSGIPLQADPTVRFALNDFTVKRVRTGHLKTDSPYNTYIYKGLPPGPIRVPSIEDVDAVLNYERHSYYYMCAKEDFSGRHSFARTFEEHKRNAEKYRRMLNKRDIK